MTELIEVEPVVIEGPHGDVDARRYVPAGDAAAALVWAHGGAWMFGDLDMPEADWVARTLASRGVAVLSIDYRKAVHGVHHPVPSDEVLAAWRWAVDHPKVLGGSAPLHLGGASAGAHLTTGVAKRLRDGDGTLPASLVLVYPLLHASLPPPSDELRAALDRVPPETLLFDDKMTRDLARNYAGDDALFDDPYAFPANGDLSGLPPTLIVNAEFDTLRASGEAFGDALADAGVEVNMVCEQGAAHGHINDPSLPEATRTLERILEWITAC